MPEITRSTFTKQTFLVVIYPAEIVANRVPTMTSASDKNGAQKDGWPRV